MHWTEYQVVGMRESPAVSGIYSSATLGDDAPVLALKAQKARGGEILQREIVATDWERYDSHQPLAAGPGHLAEE